MHFSIFFLFSVPFPTFLLTGGSFLLPFPTNLGWNAHFQYSFGDYPPCHCMGGAPCSSAQSSGEPPHPPPGALGSRRPPQVMLTLAVCLPPGHRGGCRGLRHPRRGHRSERGQHRLGPALLGHVLLDLSGREYAGRCPWGWPASELSFGLSGRVAVGGPGAPWLFGTKE